MINPVVADLLCIRALHSREFFLNPSVFYHPGQENFMSEDASRLFYYLTPNFSPTCMLSTLNRTVHGRSPYFQLNCFTA